MIILGIETSCDETACAVVENGRKILSNVIFSQIALHKKTGGVVPEVAAREHVTKIVPVLNEALKKAHVKAEGIDAFAVTAGPGLLSSLLIGVNAAMTLAKIYKKPLVPVNHVEGHIYANWLEDEENVTLSLLKGHHDKPKFPAVVLTVSGGHNELLLWKNHGKYEFLGSTLDDAAGEAFDKVARLLGLSYPGGPAIQEAAKKGDPNKTAFPRAWLKGWDFSFSGLKTAVLYAVQNFKKKNPTARESEQFVYDAAASFQEAVCEVLATKLINAAKKYDVKEVQLAGGVSANARLRHFAEKLTPPNVKLRFCKNFSLCTDNAAMIATAGFYKFSKRPAKYKKWEPIAANPNLEMKNW
ncbi:tRNA (adenosine(37)-N6)-threonylcarbamoyltransferase complex transferase subunit TsaD [Candidatus Peregrinibacteria bacterium]|nr:tRNA (adenosine(37)-N6)-threonylcarbamoyltransferase complex transferase subunit TsaD [Candidatus Peregrinibacteria bacterium]